MKYFYINELIASDVAKKYKIDNTPTEEIKDNLKYLIENLLDPIREAYGKPIYISSGYRCPALNNHKAIKGSKTSDHMKGFAADICSKNPADNIKLLEIAKTMPMWDQIINEKPYGTNNNPRWVHVSIRKAGNRKQVLLYKNGVYTKLM